MTTVCIDDSPRFEVWSEAVKWVDQCRCGESNPPYISDVVQSYYCKCRYRRALWCKDPVCGCTGYRIMGKEGFSR